MSSHIHTIISRLQAQSTELGITLYPPATEAEITHFERLKKIKLPDDLRIFYRFCNGFESEEDMFRIIPLEEILQNLERHKRNPYEFYLAEYMIYCGSWLIKINPLNCNECAIYGVRELNDDLVLTISFAEFLDKFLDAGVFEGLYDWEEKVKLRQSFFRLFVKYHSSNEMWAQYWQEIENRYSEPVRHYHTLTHLYYLLTKLTEIKNTTSNFDAVLFALYYHDIIYDPARNDNEEKSAELAIERLRSINAPELLINKVTEMIMATKTHEFSHDNDINLFTDADLSILGSDPVFYNIYKHYAEEIRKEYIMYPDEIYNEGRKKVLKHFLNMNSIFKTQYFKVKYEQPARKNIRKEMRELK